MYTYIFCKKIRIHLVLLIIFIFINCSSIFCDNKIYSPVVSAKSLISFHYNIIDWKTFLLSMLQNVCFFNDIILDGVLLVNIVKNNTDIVFPIMRITNILIELILKNTSTYSVINIDKLYSTYRTLEIFPEDNLNSYEFSIEIANYLKADYVLYSSISKDSEDLNLELQLILTKTGEIINVIRASI